MSLLRVARASLKADALLVFSWMGHDTAVVREASDTSWRRTVLTLPYQAMNQHGGVLLEADGPLDLVSTALYSTLPFRPRAALAMHSVGGSEAPIGGLLALWTMPQEVPHRIVMEPQRACGELGRMVHEWLLQQHINDRVQLFDHVMRCTVDAVLFLPEDGHHAYVNPAATALFGFDSGKVPVTAVALRLRDFGRSVINGAERDSMAASIFGRHVNVQNTLWEVGADTPRYFRVSSFRTDDGSLRGRIWMFRDVTAEERAIRILNSSQALHRSQHQFLHGVLEAMDDAVVASDTDGVLTLLNSSARARHGVDPRTPVAELSADLFSALRDGVTGNALSVDQHPMQRALKGEDVTNVPIRAQRTEGQRDLLVSARALRGGDGAVIGAVSVERDMTERKALEAQFRQNEKLQALGRMAAGVTHDVNNLLTVMQSAISALSTAPHSVGAFHDDLETLAVAVEESRVLTRSLLEFCSGRVRAAEPVRLPALLKRLQPLLRRLLTSRVQVVMDIRESDDLSVLGDSAEIEQVIFNLCSNANDAMPDGGELRVGLHHARFVGPLSHTLGVVPEGDYVVLEVSDTGVGMSADVLPHVFEPFFTTKSLGHGTGLGLSTVYGIVDRYGGHLCVDSAPQQGTRFAIYLPRLQAEDRTRDRPTACDTPVHTGPLHVLVVDDDPLVRRAVVRIVQQQGHVAVPCGSGAEGLEALTQQAFDVVLSDVQMPEMDGTQFARVVQHRFAGTPLVLMSGYADVDDGALHDLAGVHAFLTKPFTADEVRRALFAAAAAARIPAGP